MTKSLTSNIVLAALIHELFLKLIDPIEQVI